MTTYEEVQTIWQLFILHSELWCSRRVTVEPHCTVNWFFQSWAAEEKRGRSRCDHFYHQISSVFLSVRCSLCCCVIYKGPSKYSDLRSRRSRLGPLSRTDQNIVTVFVLLFAASLFNFQLPVMTGPQLWNEPLVSKASTDVCLQTCSSPTLAPARLLFLIPDISLTACLLHIWRSRPCGFIPSAHTQTHLSHQLVWSLLPWSWLQYLWLNPSWVCEWGRVTADANNPLKVWVAAMAFGDTVYRVKTNSSVIHVCVCLLSGTCSGPWSWPSNQTDTHAFWSGPWTKGRTPSGSPAGK